MTKNTKKTNLDIAKKQKNDEFFTQEIDITKELKNYKNCFKNKIVLCNCNDGDNSEFYWYFKRQFKKLKIKKLITISYLKNKKAKKYEIILNKNGELNEKITNLNQDGDFNNEESKDPLKESDIVVTNPPFSLFKEFISLMYKYKKDFLLIGPTNSLTYKEIFPLIKDDKMRIGYTFPKTFTTREKNLLTKKMKNFGNICWFTTLNVDKHGNTLLLTQKYDSKKYPKYDNYNAINVDRYKDIPKNFNGEIGVPITFLQIINFKQFKLIGHMSSTKITNYNKGYPYVNNKKKYARILIKKIN